MKRLRILSLCGIMILAIVICAVTAQVHTEPSPQMSERMEFSSIEDMVEYLTNSGNPMTRSISSNAIYVPCEASISDEFNAQLQTIEVNNNNYYYCFKVSDADVERAVASLDEEFVEDIAGENITVDEIAQPCVEDFVIGWFRDSDGEAVLNSLAAGNPLDYWEDHPGYYFTTSPFSDMTDPLGYMIYWVEGGEFFQASVPAEKLDTFWEQVDTLIETMYY